MAVEDDLPAPVFVNTLAVNGFVNGNINLAFSQARWYPKENDDEKMVVAIAEPIVVDLRMDLRCAQQVYDAIGAILEANTKPAVTN